MKEKKNPLDVYANEEEPIKVDNIEENDDKVDKAVKIGSYVVAGVATVGIILIIIISNKGKKVNNNVNNNMTSSVATTQMITNATSEEATTSATDDIMASTVDTQSFYNQIAEYRKQYGDDFAKSFSNADDVSNFVEFLNYFNNDGWGNLPSNIANADDYENIIKDYYNSCIKYNVNPNLNQLFGDTPYMQSKLSELENILSQVKTTKGSTDYTLANQYFSCLANNLCIPDNIDYSNLENCPGGLAMCEIAEVYNHEGNLYQARENEKTVQFDSKGNVTGNTLKINGKNSQELEQFLCPDSTYKTIKNDTKLQIEEQTNSLCKQNNVTRGK
jgi:hypothetical protein